MIEPMTTAARETTSRTRWALPFLAALVAVLATVFGAASVSAATGAGAETRVRASQSVAQDIARPPEAIRAGQRLGNEPAGVVTAVATGVAAEAGSSGSSLLRLSAEDSWGNPSTLARHFRDHGPDFGATSAEDYASQASQFFQRSQLEGLPTKVDSEGVIRVYDPATNTFGSFNPNGTTKTFFTPKRGVAYWNDQPGTAPWIGQ